MVTVDRVLPWRRHQTESTTAELTPLLASYRRRHPKAPVATINRAYRVAAENVPGVRRVKSHLRALPATVGMGV